MTAPCKSSAPRTECEVADASTIGDDVRQDGPVVQVLRMTCLGCARQVLFTGDGYCPTCRGIAAWCA